MPIIGRLNIPFYAARPVNLLITVLVLSLSYYYLSHHVFLPQKTTSLSYVITLLSTVFIMLGGYIHNDALDVESDLKNKPERVYISIYNFRKYKVVAFGLTTVGIGVCLFFFLIEKFPFQLVAAQLLFALLIYSYNEFLKSIPLLGNFIIALLSAWAFILPILFFKEVLDVNNIKEVFIKSLNLFTFALFSGLTMFTRELIKDEQDFEGDRIAGYKSFAQVVPNGIKSALYLACFITLTLLPFAFDLFNNSEFILLTVSLLSIPSVICGIFAFFPISKPNYKTSSLLLKLVMINGLILFYVILL
ncbi:MAG: UbiA family prenyltransferase [Flavobacteriales bacterium]